MAAIQRQDFKNIINTQTVNDLLQLGSREYEETTRKIIL